VAREPSTRLLDPPLAVARTAPADGSTLVDHLARLVGAGLDGLHAGLARTADGVAVATARPWLRRGVRRRVVADLTAAEAVTIAAPVADLLAADPAPVLVLDVLDPAAVPGALAAARAAHGTEGALWLCGADAGQLREWREQSPTVRLVRNCRLEKLRDGPERLAADLAASGLDGAKMWASDWTGGLTILFHRFDRYCLSEHAEQPRELAEQVQRGLDVVSSPRADDLVAAVAAVRP
jgi:glycerophosphoryl diester phosphodiesterase